MNKYLFIIIALLSGSMVDAQKEDFNRRYNILFIGNSLTYSNNLPNLVKKEAKLKGIRLNTKMIAFPNYAILDHWNDGEVQKVISNKNYDYVILQQGPSSQKDGRKILIDYGRKYKDLCEDNGAELCFFMVWPAMRNYATFKGIIANHREAAALTNAILLPVGEAWKAHFDKSDNYDYYSLDEFHPSQKGSQRAAEIIVEHLFLKKSNGTLEKH